MNALPVSRAIGSAFNHSLNSTPPSVVFVCQDAKQWQVTIDCADRCPTNLTHMVKILDQLGFSVDTMKTLEGEHGASKMQFALTSIYAHACHADECHADDLQTMSAAMGAVVRRALFDRISCDRLDGLIILKGFSLRQIDWVRSVIAYLVQLQFSSSRELMQDFVLAQPELITICMQFFEEKFDYRRPEKTRSKNFIHFEEKLIQKLKNVTLLSSDRFFRKFYQIIQAMVRTNYYQTTSGGSPKSCISFKLNPHLISDIAAPIMMSEIFVYHSQVEGIHLRTSKVARGGIRWSDRAEDYRTEVLGLVKAQQVKNTLIVASGAKGGFFIKEPLPSSASREEQQTFTQNCYRIFISGLLDLIDCRADCLSLPQTLCYDARDPYFVVAADKGTATFSDLANQISEEYGHWLKDAFASGGSQGYDHKKMAITARGAFCSAAHHARNLGLTQNCTMIGIGDLSGDVFGNGAILWPEMKMIAAFNHQHIIIDPTPSDQAYQERVRIQKLSKSSWADFDLKCLSPGALLVSRSQKEITLTSEVQQLLETPLLTMSPDELIKVLLGSKVDMIFNGGIGTYVKASHERHQDVSDKANDSIRINSPQLRCRMFIEGGNMGFTQKGRIEFSLLGGCVNTDTLDNSGGVDCSDHEVNLKILIDRLKDQQIFTEDRSKFLVSCTDQVAACVLEHNVKQNQVISLMEHVAVRDRFLHKQILAELVHKGLLHLEVEGFPPLNELKQRVEGGIGFTRPELIVLLAYVKLDLKNTLLANEDSKIFCTDEILQKAFPKNILKSYSHCLTDHPLVHEIAITHLINHVTNIVGISFYFRLMTETQESLISLIQASLTAMTLFKIPEKIKALEGIEGVSPAQRYEAFLQIYRLLFHCTKWLVRNHRTLSHEESIALSQRIQAYQPSNFDGSILHQSLLATHQFPAIGLIGLNSQVHHDVELFAMFENIRSLFQASVIEEKIEALCARNAFEAQTRSWLREDALKHFQIMSHQVHKEKNLEVLKKSEAFIQWCGNIDDLMKEDLPSFPQLFVLIKLLEKIAHSTMA